VSQGFALWHLLCNLSLTILPCSMLVNDWLTHETIALFEINAYYPAKMIHIADRQKVEGVGGGEATRVKAKVNFDLISARMFA
jgi:hypothetical protein